MSLVESAKSFGKALLMGIGAFVVGVIVLSLVASFSPIVAQVLAGVLALVGLVALFTKKKIVPRARLVGVLSLMLAVIAATAASTSVKQRNDDLREKDPAAYLASVKKNKSDAEYMAELQALDAAEFKAETDRRQRADEAERAAAEQDRLAKVAAEKVTYAEQLTRELEDLKTYKPPAANIPRDEVVLQVALIGARSEIYSRGAALDLAPEVLALRKQYKEALANSQAKAFPALRRALAESLRTALWEHDIDVVTRGGTASTIEFIGVSFAANRNIKDSQQELEKLLRQLRFKRSQYRWVKVSDEYTYYDMATPADSEVATLSETGWVKVD